MKKYTNINIDVEATQYTEEKKNKLVEKYMGQGVVRNIEFPNLPGAEFMYNSNSNCFYLKNLNTTHTHIYINYFIVLKDYKYSIVDPDSFNLLYEKKEDDEIPNLYTNIKTIIDAVQVTQEMIDGFSRLRVKEENKFKGLVPVKIEGITDNILTFDLAQNNLILNNKGGAQLTINVNDYIIYISGINDYNVANEESFLKQFTPVENG